MLSLTTLRYSVMATFADQYCHLFKEVQMGKVDESPPISHRFSLERTRSGSFCAFFEPACLQAANNNTCNGGHFQQLHAPNCRRLETQWVVTEVQACLAASRMATSWTRPAGWQSLSLKLLPRVSPVTDLAALTMLLKIRSANVHAQCYSRAQELQHLSADMFVMIRSPAMDMLSALVRTVEQSDS